jgi:hypothetical protein
MFTPAEDFDHQLLLASFSLSAHSLRLLANAGLLDDQARQVIRNYLHALQAKLAAIQDDPQLQAVYQGYLDTLVGVLPPTTP